jgi:hypothetical protein
MTPSQIGILVLLASLAGNVFLWHSRDAAIKEVGEMETKLTQSVNAGKTCSESVKQLKKDADDLKEKNAGLVKIADSQAKKLEAKALATLSGSAQGKTVCESVHLLNQAKINERNAAKGKP